ncbi:hypothetical protein CDV31_010444 [Fusarium ambrosium]|uniref:Fungal N-terminal domain-containing protein n=1 Tax=Fusarium ambrosium TaxID=131363 RepID=A0A428TN78_9HYPO|nr:hypothetical protein CDV31_010444 [Fusarium ambrosium]
MDPLSVSASIAGLVTLADLVFRATSRYAKQVKGAPKEVQDLMNEVKDLSCVLHNLSLVAFSLETDPDPQNANTPKPYHLHECRQLLRQLEEKLPVLETQSSRQKLQSRLKWPFSSSETKEILASVSRHKQTINIALAADSISKLNLCLSQQQATGENIKDIQHSVGKILDIETKISLDRKRREVLNAFNKVDARLELEKNRTLRHPMTGLWLTESSDFEDWYSTPKARIWCSGIPGAGKSVIAGAVVDECLQRTQTKSGTAVGYFFCTYRDPLTFTANNILSSLCSQLALQDETAYRILEAYHDELQSNHIRGLPTTPGLVQTLCAMCKIFTQAYLIVNGLDECGDEVESTVDDIVSLSLADANHNIHLFLLSRDEFMIRQRTMPQFHWIEIEAHTEDVQLYVATELEQRIGKKKLRLRDMALKDEILAKLVEGAKGMFRWVACQLDHLCDLPHDRARRKALNKLPPTLPATYERILLKMDNDYDEETKQLVQRTLLLVFRGFPAERLSVRELCEAISISEDSDTLDDDAIVEKQDILRWCGSLLRTAREGQDIEFAHYTVQEYLQNDCQTHPTLGVYSVSEAKSRSLYLRLSLRYLTLRDFEGPLEANERGISSVLERTQQHCFYEHASIYWPTAALLETDESLVATQLYKLFDINKIPQFYAWAVELIRHCILDGDEGAPFFWFYKRSDFGRRDDTGVKVISAVLRPDFTPLHLAAALGLTPVCQYLLENGAKPNLRSRFGTPLHCALGSLSVFTDVDVSDVVLHVLQGGMQPTARQKTTRLLLQAGSKANMLLNTPFRTSTILSLVVFSSGYGDDFEIIVDLIKNGVPVEEEDLRSIAGHYQFAKTVYSPEEFKKKYHNGQAFTKLLEALRTPERTSCGTILEKNMKEEDLRGFVYSAIVENNVTILEKLLSSGRSELVNSTGLDPANPSFTPLHIAIRERSLDALNMLLASGGDPNIPDENGHTPVHGCWDEDMLCALIRCGGSTMSLDNNGDTIWHLSAMNNSVRILKVLVEQDERDSALHMVSAKGNTPMSQAMFSGSRDAALFLLEYCGTENHWVCDKPIFRTAAALGCSSVIQKLLDVGVEKDAPDEKAGNPLHHLNPSSDLQCIQQLGSLFSLAERRKEDMRTSFELMCLSLLGEEDSRVEKCYNLLISLLPVGVFSEPHQASPVWSFLCLEAIPRAIQNYPEKAWVRTLVADLLGRGVSELYEEENDTSALLPFISHLAKVGSSEREDWIERSKEGKITDYFATFGDWKWISETTARLTKDTKFQANVAVDPSLIQLLFEAIIHEDLDLVELLLEIGVDCHSRGAGLSPFELACLPNTPENIEIFDLLLEHTNTSHFSQENPVFSGYGPLHLTAGVGPWPDGGSVKKLQRLLEAGAGPDSPLVTWSPLGYHILQGSIDTAETLIEAGADIWSPVPGPNDGPLAAMAQGCLSLLLKMAEHTTAKGLVPQWDRTYTVPIGDRDVSGINYLHVAATLGRVECLEFYLSRGLLTDLEARDDQQETPVHHAARSGHVSVLELLKNHGADINSSSASGETPLHLAVREQHLDAVKALIKLGAKHQACSDGCLPIIYAYDTGNSAIISALEADSGCSDEATAGNLRGLRKMANALRMAINRQDIDACQRIHALGCPLDVEIQSKMMPLMFAILEKKGVEVVRWLLDNGSKVSTPCWDHSTTSFSTALHAALARPMFNALLPALVSKFVDEAGDFASARNPLVIAIKSRNPEGLVALVNTLRIKGQLTILASLIHERLAEEYSSTPLHFAAHFNDLDAAKALLDNKADIDALDEDNNTPLHITVSERAEEVTNLLIARGARLNQRDRWFQTPLHTACMQKSWQIVRLLTQAEAIPNTVDYCGDNILRALTRDEGYYGKFPDARILEKFLDHGLDPFQTNDDGLSAAHDMLASKSAACLRHTLRRSPGIFQGCRFLWPHKQILYGPLSPRRRLLSISKNLRLISQLLANTASSAKPPVGAWSKHCGTSLTLEQRLIMSAMSMENLLLLH